MGKFIYFILHDLFFIKKLKLKKNTMSDISKFIRVSFFFNKYYYLFHVFYSVLLTNFRSFVVINTSCSFLFSFFIQFKIFANFKTCLTWRLAVSITIVLKINCFVLFLFSFLHKKKKKTKKKYIQELLKIKYLHSFFLPFFLFSYLPVYYFNQIRENKQYFVFRLRI